MDEQDTEIIYYSPYNGHVFHYLATRWGLSALFQTHVSLRSGLLRTVGTAVQEVSKRGRVDGEDSLIFTYQPQTFIFTHQPCAVVLCKTNEFTNRDIQKHLQ